MNKYADKSRKFNLHRRIHGGKCIRKKQHATEQQAREFAESRGLPQRPYRCQFCPCWHLRSS